MKEADKLMSGGERVIVTLSFLIAVLSIVFFILTIFFPGKLERIGFTGYATAGNTTSGIINLTVQTGVVINFSIDTIQWGTGSVNAGAQNATLDTSKRDHSLKVVNGNWSGVTHGNKSFYDNRTNGLILQNLGNVNVSLYLISTANATNLIGGTSPSYQINITNNKTGSCFQNVASEAYNATNLTTYMENNNFTGSGKKLCDMFGYEDTKDEIRVDIYLRVPSDSKTGLLQDTITATAIQV